jgi:ERF superfamily
MQQSAEIKNLAEALTKFQKDVENVPKDAVNPFFKSKYASLENVIATVRPHLAKHGLSFSQFPDGDGLTTVLMHSSGEWLQATSKMTPKDATPQGQGSAITYLRRYALSAVLGLATEDDDDGNAASAPAKAPAASKTAPTKRANPPVYKSPGIKEQEAKKRIADLILKLTDEEAPSDKAEAAKFYGDKVFEFTGMSLNLATLEDLETIGDELGKLFDNQE